MTMEIEAKIKVDSHDVVRAQLTKAGAEFVCRVTEVNHIFDTQDRRLLSSGCGLRIRTCRGQGCVPQATLTYKGPAQAGALKIRDELETGVLNAEAAIDILQSLGFTPVMVFEKRRETWHTNDTEIELDEVPWLGFYVEIEGPHEQAIRDTQGRLGLGGEPTIHASYVALLVEHAREHGLSYDRITF